ncbi:MAG: aminopeptidase P N-terminal domain-containing protein, partial [Clostridiales bacterium]|nr:aminopeptidase P N-terminal domain-containing protein [Clostridiales bacterium]
MTPIFHTGNRKALAEKLKEGSLALVYSGEAPIKTSDEYYPFFADRNFVYLTGIQERALVLLLQKDAAGYRETLFIQPSDVLLERWNGRRIKPDAAAEVSGISDVRLIGEFDGFFRKLAISGHYDKLCLDLNKERPNLPDDSAFRAAGTARGNFPWLAQHNLRPLLKSLRLIKQPCEIEAMKYAETITRDGIVAMMKASAPGMYEYEYKAEWDYALAKRGVLSSGFPPIISAGNNNFCVHYYDYTGQSQDGDLILNDVGAVWDGMINDVSRAWPCGGRYSERQKLLYLCAYNTSNHMFKEVIRPDLPMKEVDGTIRRVNYEYLKASGVCRNFEEIGKYMWHGGAHHIGW